MGKKKKKNSNKKTEEKKTEEKKTEEKKAEEKAEEKKTEEKKAEEKKPEEKKSGKKKAEKKKAEEKKPEAKKPVQISESEKKQREKNRQKALKESRSKKSAKAKAKFQKEREKKAKQKAVKKVRKLEARREQLKKRILQIRSFSLSENARNNILIGAFIIAIIMINIAVFATSSFKQAGAGNEETLADAKEEFLLPEEPEPLSDNTVSSDEEDAEKEEPQEEKKKSSSFNAAESEEDNLQDVYPHEGGLYFMPVANDEESVTGALLGTCILKKDEYDNLKEGEVLDFANDKYMILSISKGGEYGTALSMTAFDEDEDYERVFKEEKSYEDYFGYEKIVYGMTLALEEEQIKQMGSPDYFGNDGYEDDDMIFFAGTSLYFPLTYTMDEDVKLYFDDDCILTVPDDTMIGDEEYDVKDYLAGKHSLFPPDLMAAKIETKGNRITKYNVMFAGLEGLE